MSRTSRRRPGPRLTWSAFLLRLVRFPVDVVFLCVDFARLTGWLLMQAFRHLRRQRGKAFQPCLGGAVEATAHGPVKRCDQVRKYGSPGVFKVLYPDIKLVQASAGHWFHSWGGVSARAPVSPGTYLRTALVPGFLCAVAALCLLRWQAPGRFQALLARLGVPVTEEAVTPRLGPARNPDQAQQLAGEGAALAAAGRLDEARAKYLDAVHADPLSTEAQAGLGAVSLSAGLRDPARLAFVAALGRDPACAVALRGMGQISLEDGALEAAVTHLDLLLHALPDDLQGLILRAKVHAAMGQAQAADLLVNRACELHAEASDAWLAKGNLALSRRQLDAAEAAIRRAQQLAPDGIEARLGLLRVQIERGQLAESERVAQALFADQPAREDVILVLIDVMQRRGQFTDAIRVALESARRRPDFIGVRLALGGLYVRTGRLNEAYKAAAALLAEKPGTAAAHLQIVTVLQGVGLPGLAVDHSRTAVAQAPGNVAALRLLGNALMSDGQVSAAVEVFRKVIAKRPNDVEMQVQLARCDLFAGQTDAAAATLRKLAAENPQVVDVHVALTEVEYRQQNVARALEHSRNAYRLEPDNLMAINNYAALLAYAKRDLDEALSLAHKATAMVPDSPAVADTLGWVLVQRGQAQEAIAPLSYAVRRAPGSGDVLYHYAAALHLVGRDAEARQCLESALANDANFLGSDAARVLLAQLPKAPAPATP